MTLAKPELTDGHLVHQLISACPPLDTNSAYCNLLQCDHFSNTSVIAKQEGAVVGFISGYLKPVDPSVLFVWQVAVGQAARGKGLATQMLDDLLSRDALKHVRFIETTITADNDASWALFKRYAKKCGAPLNHSDYIDKAKHFNNEHDSEILVRIGPFNK